MKNGYGELLALLPVRHPMVLVDRVADFEHGVSIDTVKAVTGGEPCYQDIADGLPAERYAYPRSLILESFGQSAALLWLGSTRTPRADGGTDGTDRVGGTDRVDGTGATDRSLPMVGRLRHCAFRGAALPGDVIRHRVRVERFVDDNAFMTGESRVGDQVVLTVGSLIAVARPATAVTGGGRPDAQGRPSR